MDKNLILLTILLLINITPTSAADQDILIIHSINISDCGNPCELIFRIETHEKNINYPEEGSKDFFGRQNINSTIKIELGSIVEKLIIHINKLDSNDEFEIDSFNLTDSIESLHEKQINFIGRTGIVSMLVSLEINKIPIPQDLILKGLLVIAVLIFLTFSLRTWSNSTLYDHP